MRIRLGLDGRVRHWAGAWVLMASGACGGTLPAPAVAVDGPEPPSGTRILDCSAVPSRDPT